MKGSPASNGRRRTPYFFFSRSGLNAGIPVVCTGPHEPGNLVVVRMRSRRNMASGVRSNRSDRKASISPIPPSDPLCDGDYPSCLLDVAVKHIDFDGTGGWPHYGHPESMQTVGNILVFWEWTHAARGPRPRRCRCCSST